MSEDSHAAIELKMAKQREKKKAELRNHARTGDLTFSSERPIQQNEIDGDLVSARLERDR